MTIFEINRSGDCPTFSTKQGLSEELQKNYKKNEVQVCSIFGKTFELEAKYCVVNLAERECFPLSRNLSRCEKLLRNLSKYSQDLLSQEGFANCQNSKKEILAKFVSNSNDIQPLSIVVIDKAKTLYLSVFPLENDLVLATQFTFQRNRNFTSFDRTFNLDVVYPVSAAVVNKETILSSFFLKSQQDVIRTSQIKRKASLQSNEYATEQDGSNKHNSDSSQEKVVSSLNSRAHAPIPLTTPQLPHPLLASGSDQSRSVKSKADVFNLKREGVHEKKQMDKECQQEAVGKESWFMSGLKKIFRGGKSTPKVLPSESSQIIFSKHQKANERIYKYQNILTKIKAFIEDKPELQELCKEYLIIDRPNIAIPAHVDASLDPNDEVDAMTLARIKGNNLEHMFNEWIEFIQRNKVLAEAFNKYIKADPAAFLAFQELVNLPE